ncbi:MAG: HD domain-containing protein, partial [Gammaproteobacteria bacterium]
QAALLSSNPMVRFAALVHDLGKGLTPRELWPHHYGHEKNGLAALEHLCDRLRVPNAYRILAMQVMRYHTQCHRALELRATTLTDTLSVLGAFKTGNHFAEFLLACEADARGRTGFEDVPYPQADYLRGAARAAAAVDTNGIVDSQLKGRQIGEAIRQSRIRAITAFQNRSAAMSALK